ncbi:MAG TPA: molybdopterin-dependent oxidoreductase [Gemmatimonadales bacterium]|jgi:molybdopterin-containing oxidoreductase family iron-sulfur binding subunit
MTDQAEASGVDRRQFLKVIGTAGAGAAILSGCSTERISTLVPYMVQSEDQVPGIPTWYASTCSECNNGCGVYVKTREGRPIKLEGNPDHPVNAGTLCSRGQAGLQALYNPDRLAGPMAKNAAGKWDAIKWDDAIARFAAKVGATNGELAVINGYSASTFSTMLTKWTAALNGFVTNFQPFSREPERLANQKTWGRDDLPVYDFAAAKYIVSFGADFLETWGSVVEQQRGFATSHGFNDGAMSRAVFVGPRLSLTAANADEWVNVPAGSETLVALAMAHVVAAKTGSAVASALTAYAPEQVAKDTGLTADQITKLANAFAAASPSLAVAGGVGAQHRGAIDLCHAVNLLNEAAGNVGKTVMFGAAPSASEGYGSIQPLFDRMSQGQFQVVLVHDANPLFTLPKSGKFTESFRKVAFKVSTATVLDETAAECDLILPNLHGLERWDDLMPRKGVLGMLQPVVEPVRGGMHTGDVLLQASQKIGGAVASFNAKSYEAYLKAEWEKSFKSSDFATDMREALGRGGVYTASTTVDQPKLVATTALAVTTPTFDGPGDYVLMPYPSMQYHDGRGANKPWLLENPDPITKITWQSWVEIHPDTAQKLDVREGEIVELTSPHGKARAQVYVYAGVRPDTFAMPIGLGHTEYGRYAQGRGVNPLDLVGAADGQGFLPYVGTKVSVARTGDYHQVARVDGTPRQLGRGIIQTMPVANAIKKMTPEESYKAIGRGEAESNPELEQKAIAGFYEAQLDATKFGDYANEHPKWGMAVDLSRCTGCSACVTACYAENNIPTVGEEQVFRRREMSWMRIERYWEGGTNGEPLQARFSPVMCQHCDNAPCEPVCPVYASYHTADGLNGQVYNRCVGTRYCSNNCPFKVRYFNWLKYNESAWPEPLNLQLNPDVITRVRGVMEKCTFCVQRIRSAQNTARLEDRDLKDGEIVTACAQSCPSGAIKFGNVKDPNAKVVQWKQNHRGYVMLEETNVRPSVTYLAKVLNIETAAFTGAEER